MTAKENINQPSTKPVQWWRGFRASWSGFTASKSTNGRVMITLLMSLAAIAAFAKLYYKVSGWAYGW